MMLMPRLYLEMGDDRRYRRLLLIDLEDTTKGALV